MSQDYSQYDQSFDQGNKTQASVAPPKKGCNRGCLFLLILLGVIIAALGGMFIWLVQNIASNLTNDPKVIGQRLVERFPSARMPAAYEGMVGMKVTVFFDMDLLVFGTDETVVAETGEVMSGDALILFTFKVPGIDEVNMEDALDAGNNGGKLIEKNQVILKAGEYEFSGWRQKVIRDSGNEEKKLFYQVVVPLGKNTAVVLQNDQEKVDQAALEQFLRSIAKDCPLARKVER